MNFAYRMIRYRFLHISFNLTTRYIHLLLVNSRKEFFTIISKDRAHRLYKEVYEKCMYWLEKFLAIGSKQVIWKLFATKNSKYMNNHTALDWIKMGSLDSIIGRDDFVLFLKSVSYGMHVPDFLIQVFC